MKKLLSIFMSVAMLVSCFAISGFETFAAAMTDVPAVELNKAFAVEVAHSDEDYFESIEDEAKADWYYAKFTPTAKGSYEFSFDTAFTSANGEDVMLMAMLLDNTGELVQFSMAMDMSDLTEADRKELEELGLGLMDNPSFTADLKAKTTYYLAMINTDVDTYKSNVTIKTHTHTMKKETRPGYAEDGFYMSGEVVNVCSYKYCDAEETVKEIPAIKYVDIAKSSYTYTGKAIKPNVIIKTTDGKKLSAKYYDVKYLKNKKVGTAKIKITFKGNYEGSETITFKINPKKTSIKSVTPKKKSVAVKWAKQKAQTTGYQIQYSTSSKFIKKTTKSVKVKGAKKTSKTIKNLKSGKKYYVRIRTYKTVGKKTYYSSWSKKTSVKVK